MSDDENKFGLKKFQNDAIDALLGYMEDEKIHNIVLESPTGSGKTVILTHLMNRYQHQHRGSGTVFVWFTPGAGNLDDQSRKAMEKYFIEEKSQIKTLENVLSREFKFKEGDYCFISWETVNKTEKEEKDKKGKKENVNVAWRPSENGSLDDKIKEARESNGLNFKLIIDESHRNDTKISNKIIGNFSPDKVLWSSATPKKTGDAIWKVSDDDVIKAKLIKKQIFINTGFQQDEAARLELDADEQAKDKKEYKEETEDTVGYLLRKGLEKQKRLRELFTQKRLDINPLIIVQLPTKSSGTDLREQVEEFLRGKADITYENKKLALWLADDKRNLEIVEDGVVVQKIENNNATPIVLIIKQAVATGWDCPRAYILVKFREHSSEDFDIQTIGRIRRMPEAKHYEENYTDDELNSCYIYTFDTRFKEGVKDKIGGGARSVLQLLLKQDVRIDLTKERWKEGTDSRDPQKALEAIIKYFDGRTIDGKTLLLGGDEETNKAALREFGLEGEKFFIPTEAEEDKKEKIKRVLVSKRARTLDQLLDSTEKKEEVIYTELSADDAEWELHRRIGEICKEIGMHYYDMRTLLFRLFCEEEGDKKDRFLSLSVREMYFFIINNATVLRRAFREAMAKEFDSESEQQELPKNACTEKFLLDINNDKLSLIPFTYDEAKVKKDEKGNQEVSKKNVYDGYLLSAAKPRSGPELQFEKFCEDCSDVEWIYKNGDHGKEYFSIVYRDNWSKQKLFFPDYILSIKGKICIIETKGGFGESGGNEDSDLVSEKKLKALKRYLKMHNLNGGIVRFDKSSEKPTPLIATERYSKDPDDAWEPLEDFIKRL